MSHALPTLPADAGRTLLLLGQGLLDDPTRRAGPRSTQRVIEQLGFVQVDTIQVVERAHHHILGTRLDGYRPTLLAGVLERERSAFEHFTRDAAAIRSDWLPFWRHRFERYRKSDRAARWVQRKLGDDGERLLRHVWTRITREGPLRSRDFEGERPEGGSGFWSWKPKRAALEYLWRIGRISIAGRDGFEKVYDRTDRVFPGLGRGRRPSTAALRGWACREALLRLGVATPTEIAYFLRAITPHEAATWCASAAKRGEVVAVREESADGSAPREAVTLPDWKARADAAPAPPDRMRLTSPFEPALHDRSRALRSFAFDYRLECFVPPARRRFGYYVLPILDGEHMVGRLDPKLHRDRGVLEVRGLWWDAKPTRTRRRRLEEALDRLAGQVGAERFVLPRKVSAG